MKYLKNDSILKQRRQELRRNQTEVEKAFWSRVRSSQFHRLRFFRQYSVGPYILDFYCPALKLAVELDGGQHNDPDNRAYDAERATYLIANGIKVIRFWNHEVLGDIEEVLSKLEEKVTPLNPPLD